MKTLIKDLTPDKSVNSYFTVKDKTPLKEYKKGLMFVLQVSDRTGDIELYYWGKKPDSKVQKLFDSISAGDVIRARGKAKYFNERLEIDVNQGEGDIEKPEPGEYDLEDFIPRTNQDVEAMWSYLVGIKDSFKHTGLKSLLDDFFSDEDFVEAFKRAPGAMYYHHACIGGLLEHTWGVVRLLETAYEIHPSLDRDLMMAGGILHDVGKTAELEIGAAISVSEAGMLLGHISLGEEMIRERVKKIKLGETISLKLLHIIVSHHGKNEHGALKEPLFPEACAVYYADMLDSQLTRYIRAKKDTNTGDFRAYVKKLGEIYLK